MRHSVSLMAITCAIIAHAAEQRTYIAERGDTWESVARKWGLYTEELKANNPFLNELYTGLEIDLPNNAVKEPLSTRTIATYEIADRDLEIAKKKIEAKQYQDAIWHLNSATTLRGRSTAGVLFLKGQANEGRANYEEAYDFYKKSLSRHSNGDNTLSKEQINCLSQRIKETGELAEAQRKKREAEEEMRRERTRKAEEARIRRSERTRVTKTTAATTNNWGGDMVGWGWPILGPVWNMPAIQPPIQPQFVPSWNPPAFTPPAYTEWTFDPSLVNSNFIDTNSSFDNTPSSSGSTLGNQITFSDHQCTLCNGKGTIVDSGATTFGLSSTKYCNECGQHVSLSHRHIQCPSCQGKGTVRKRDR